MAAAGPWESLKRVLRVLPVSSRLLRLIWPFLAIVVVVVVVAIQVTDVLSASRAFVEGESRWSKAQKESVFSLLRYSETFSEIHYVNYLKNIETPIKLGQARLELEKSDPDYDKARQYFLEGGDHPDDISGVIRLYTRFRKIWYIKKIVRVWEEGDRLVAELNLAADELHEKIQSGVRSPAALRPTMERIRAVNDLLTPLEVEFSDTLGEANRITKVLLLILTLTLPAILVPMGIVLSQRTLRHSEEFERALKVSEERFQLAVSGSNDGVWDWNIVTDTWYYSPRFKQLVGYGDDEMKNSLSALVARLHPEEQAMFSRALELHLREDSAFDVEIRLLARSGDYRWFRLRGQSVRNAEGEAVRMAGALTDVTEKKIAAAELFAEKERALVTLASIADGVITTDTEGWVEYLNPVAEELTGWKSADARGTADPGPVPAGGGNATPGRAEPDRAGAERGTDGRGDREHAAGPERRRGDSGRAFRGADPRPLRGAGRRGAGPARRQPRTAVRSEALLPGEPRLAHRPHQPGRVRTASRHRAPVGEPDGASSRRHVPRSRPVQGGERHLRARGRRPVDAAGEHAPAPLPARGRHPGAPGRRRVRRPAGELPAGRGPAHRRQAAPDGDRVPFRLGAPAASTSA